MCGLRTEANFAIEGVQFLRITEKGDFDIKNLTIKEPNERSMVWEPNHRSNFFFSLCRQVCVDYGIKQQPNS